jgi:type II secretory ATPase GspE/PulE/Tfp pilus assembly ATPase PilB-like protein
VPEPDARILVDQLLADAVARRASDVHVEPTDGGYEVRFRVDGLLAAHRALDADAGRAVVLRLMVLAKLLTYRLEVPQEGRFAFAPREGEPPLDLRLSTIPTAQGLRAAVRLPAELLQPRSLDELGLPDHALAPLRRFAQVDAGLLLVTGPAGSGKTTTLYALLGHIAQVSPGLSIISIEDPVERRLPGVTQVQVDPAHGLSYEQALRSILRQDPQVLMLGEIRDAATASLAVQAALSGHRLLCTLHAGDPAAALARLLEMGLEPYQVAGSVYGVLSQRLLRRVSREVQGGAAPEPVKYAGRVPVAEFVGFDDALRAAVLARADVASLRKIVCGRAGHVTIRASADALVAEGVSDAAEVRRVLGE